MFMNFRKSEYCIVNDSITEIKLMQLLVLIDLLKSISPILDIGVYMMTTNIIVFMFMFYFLQRGDPDTILREVELMLSKQPKLNLMTPSIPPKAPSRTLLTTRHSAHVPIPNPQDQDQR